MYRYKAQNVCVKTLMHDIIIIIYTSTHPSRITIIIDLMRPANPIIILNSDHDQCWSLQPPPHPPIPTMTHINTKNTNIFIQTLLYVILYNYMRECCGNYSSQVINNPYNYFDISRTNIIYNTIIVLVRFTTSLP